MADPKRLLVPDSQTIVILDTGPARHLSHSEEAKEWCATFALMAQDGYSFSLADGAAAELIEQRYRETGGLTAEQCGDICALLETFLNPELPIMLGKVDIGGMLGLAKVPWSADQSRAHSLHFWSKLKKCAMPALKQQPLTRELQDEREDWIAMFDGWQRIFDKAQQEDPSERLNAEDLTEGMLQAMDAPGKRWGTLTPPMSLRNHLSNRYYWRQFVRKQQKRNAYNPRSKKKENDGIDADLLRYLPLPALIVTEDTAFLSGFQDIKSFQTAWIFRAKDLSDAWRAGNGPRPTWPEDLR